MGETLFSPGHSKTHPNQKFYFFANQLYWHQPIPSHLLHPIEKDHWGERFRVNPWTPSLQFGFFCQVSFFPLKFLIFWLSALDTLSSGFEFNWFAPTMSKPIEIVGKRPTNNHLSRSSDEILQLSHSQNHSIQSSSSLEDRPPGTLQRSLTNPSLNSDSSPILDQKSKTVIPLPIIKEGYLTKRGKKRKRERDVHLNDFSYFCNRTYCS